MCWTSPTRSSLPIPCIWPLRPTPAIAPSLSCVFRTALENAPLAALRLSLNQNQPLGKDRFYAEIEAVTRQRREPHTGVAPEKRSPRLACQTYSSRNCCFHGHDTSSNSDAAYIAPPVAPATFRIQETLLRQITDRLSEYPRFELVSPCRGLVLPSTLKRRPRSNRADICHLHRARQGMPGTRHGRTSTLHSRFRVPGQLLVSLRAD